MSTQSSLSELDHGTLIKSAESLGIAVKGLSDIQLVDAIEKQAIKKKLRFEREAKEELRREQTDKLGASRKTRPSIQDVAIQHSRKVIALFLNMEHPAADGEDGADLMFSMGQHSFHIYDNHRFVLPECVVTDDPLANEELRDILRDFWVSTGMPSKRAMAQAIGDLLQISLPRRCSYPIYESRPDPRNPERHISVMTRTEPRFRFQIIGPAPDDAELGDLADPDTASDALKSDEQLIKEKMQASAKGARPSRT